MMIDYLNKQHLRNETNTDVTSYNCGGYALRTYSWYNPYFDIEAKIDTLLDEDYLDDEIEDFIYDALIKNILSDFCDDIRMLQDNKNDSELTLLSQLKDDEELIAFRIGFYYDESVDGYIYDFHFRVRRDGQWSEKCGEEDVKECVFSKGVWNGYCMYCGRICYFAKKIK